jgi:hypothetical protein
LVVVAQLVCDFTRDKNPLRDFLPVLSSFRRKILREQCTRPKAQTPRVESAEETGFQVMGYRIRGFRPTFCLSLSLQARFRGALLRGSQSPCFASLPVTLCRTLRAMLVGDPRDRIRSSRLPHSAPALDSGLFLVAFHNLASPRALAPRDHDAPGVLAGIDLGATWPRRAARPRVRGFRPTFLPLSRFTRPPAARCSADLGLRSLFRCL